MFVAGMDLDIIDRYHPHGDRETAEPAVQEAGSDFYEKTHLDRVRPGRSSDKN